MEWKRFVASLLLAAALAAPAGAFPRKHRSRGSEAGKTEQVGTYTTKKGKHVKAYKRHPKGTAPKAKSKRG